jgi:uncharacterized protein YjbJ (UPF0337 family)
MGTRNCKNEPDTLIDTSRVRIDSVKPATAGTFLIQKRSPGLNLPTRLQRSDQMNWDRIEGNWKEFKGKAQKQWGKLTNDDLEVVKGKRTELAGRLQQRYGYGKDQADREIDAWLKDVH